MYDIFIEAKVENPQIGSNEVEIDPDETELKKLYEAEIGGATVNYDIVKMKILNNQSRQVSVLLLLTSIPGSSSRRFKVILKPEPEMGGVGRSSKLTFRVYSFSANPPKIEAKPGQFLRQFMTPP